jgi:erythromycin esterase
MPESFAIDAYVRGGPGDPAVLLSNLYFWTWNTQEVLDMIQWMRAYNGSVAPDRQVRFFGFDMQSAGAAIDTVVAYMQRVDAPRLSSVTSAYACLAPYRNFGRRSSSAQYSTLPPAQRVVCRASVAFVDSMLLANRAAYEASGVAAYARARQSARLVVQWEDMRAQSVAGVGSSRRDQYMAENTLWLLDQLPAGSKMVLWAHNFHVSNGPASMGGHLRRALGPAYLIAGFTFGSGAFNAIEQSATGAFGALRAMSTSAHRVGSIESYFAALGVPRLMLDARRIPGASTATFLAGPMGMRSVGSVYRPGNDLAYFSTVLLPSDYDVLIHFGETSASTLLPFRYE